MDIDTGLFQLMTLALLGVTLLVLVGTLVSLNKLSKKLEGLGTSGAHSMHAAHAHENHSHEDHEHQDHHDDHAHHDEPEPADYSPTATSAASEPAPETVGAAPAAAEPSAGFERPEEVAQEQQEVAPEPVATEAPIEQETAPTQQEPERVAAEPEPVPAEPEPVAAAPAPTSTGFEDAPEEQPFEREGRWWFKRGDEILVYDEQTGQWGPAPVATPPAAASVAEGGDADWGRPQGGGQAQGDWDQEQTQGWGPVESAHQQGEAAAPASTFWKCRSCGAINGATATACRMCFTPKG